MSKYKKIFSGLGLLSISTLVGASAVACANKNPNPKDSSTEAIDQNNNQGNSTTPKDSENTPGNPTPEAPKTPEKPEKTPEQGGSSSSENSGKTNENDKKDKPGEGMGAEDLTTLKKEAIDAVEKIKGHSKYDELKAKVDKDGVTKEELNDAKTIAINELNNFKNEVNSDFEAIKDKSNLKTQKSKLTVATKYQELKAIKNEILPTVKKELNNSIDILAYQKSDESTATKKKLKEKINMLSSESNYAAEYKKIKDLDEALKMKNSEIDSLYNLDNFKINVRPSESNASVKSFFRSKLSVLDSAEKVSKFTIPTEFKNKFNEYKKLINDDFWGEFTNQFGLNKRLIQFYNEDINGKTDEYILDHSEAVLIWNIYETIRQHAYKSKIFALSKLTKEKKNEYLNNKVVVLPDGKALNHNNNLSNRFVHNKDMKWLVENLTKLKTEYENAKKEV
ncbi:Vmc-like lipoprotein signal peptide domain-containing protein [Mycoplasmopsis cynos]|uniref:Vmc-like lipoprotein signal peptide domain-containing protein n=1 Tax=Mycoplasmopsis cynos TaxID=171284 RepID=UPI0030CA9CB9